MTSDTDAYMTVTITFCTPSRERGEGGGTVHERVLDGVPHDAVVEMARDFVQYNSDEASAQRSKLYQYDQDSNEVLIALDYGEIIALTATEE